MTRRDLRALLRARDTREDGTTYTKPLLDSRRAERRRKNAAAKRARKRNR
jgi:hypothetical protein